jgi:hypothetical protein
MADRSLPKKLQKRYKVSTVEEMWRKVLTEGNVYIRSTLDAYSAGSLGIPDVSSATPHSKVGEVD